MVDREKALHLLMGRYRYEEAMRLFGEYCLLLDEDWNDFVARHSPIRLRQLHKQLLAVGLWPLELVPPVRGTGLLDKASAAVTGLLGQWKPPVPEAPAAAVAPDATPRRGELEAGRDPDAVLASLVSPAISLEFNVTLLEHAAVGGEGSPLHDAIALSRYRIAHELGFVFPLVHLRENPELAPDAYALRFNGETVGEGRLAAECVAALGPGLPPGWAKELHPARELELSWIAANAASAWEGATQTPAEIVAEHLETLVRRLSHRLFTNQTLDTMLRAYEPEIGKDALGELFGRFMSLTELRLVLQAMLKAGYSVRNMPRIIDVVLGHYIRTFAEKPMGMEESWKISSHVPFFSTDELTRVICRELGLVPLSERHTPFTASLERALRQSADLPPQRERPIREALPPPGALDPKEARERFEPGKGAN